ncbi:hypothetical protein H5410_051860 [Solanum commersonii]|uniref:Uncharacterized protein n=1 Tax=Solanum commersonii TaxID=4109 RepID=A0A9J5WZ96_SOLCO|nr:hypothetical protein H5410_051860 [Solanum commersonii]
MTNSTFSSKLPFSQEIENPGSFNFFTLSLEESPLTPLCGVSEMGESITPHTEVVASSNLPSGEILPYSPMLILSGEKSPNSESQSIIKPSADPPTEELEVLSRGVSSTMSERLFDGDLSKRKGPEVSILIPGEELVDVQSLSSLRGNVQPTLLEQKLRSPEQVPHSVLPVFDQTRRLFDVESDKEEEEEVPLKWSRKVVRGANTLIVGVPDLETVKSTPEVVLTDEPTEFAKERKRKGKGKLVESNSKKDKKRYGTKSEMQKDMGSAIAVNVIQTERIRKRRWEGHLPEEPTSTPLLIGPSDTESDDMT